MDRTELAWAAGFWDGEGSAYLSGAAGRASRQPVARVNQAGATGIPEVLSRFRRAAGFGMVKGPTIGEGKLPLYRWEVTKREDVRALYDLLRTWLGDVKATQFRDVLTIEGPVRAWQPQNRVEELAWCGGLFDGEGSTCLIRHGSHAGYFALEANITQSSWNGRPEVLIRFRDVFGVGEVYGPYPSPKGHAPVYKWRAYKRDEIASVLELMDPFLGPIKRSQGRKALDVVRAQTELPRGNPAWGNRKTHCVNGHEYATARVRPFRSRGKNTEPPRASEQCLACLREYAQRKRREGK